MCVISGNDHSRLFVHHTAGPLFGALTFSALMKPFILYSPKHSGINSCWNSKLGIGTWLHSLRALSPLLLFTLSNRSTKPEARSLHQASCSSWLGQSRVTSAPCDTCTLSRLENVSLTKCQVSALMKLEVRWFLYSILWFQYALSSLRRRFLIVKTGKPAFISTLKNIYRISHDGAVRRETSTQLLTQFFIMIWSHLWTDWLVR